MLAKMHCMLVSKVSIAVATYGTLGLRLIGSCNRGELRCRSSEYSPPCPTSLSYAPRLRGCLDTARASSLKRTIPKHFKCQTSGGYSFTRTDRLWQVPSPAVPHLHSSAVGWIEDGRYRVVPLVPFLDLSTSSLYRSQGSVMQGICRARPYRGRKKEAWSKEEIVSLLHPKTAQLWRA